MLEVARFCKKEKLKKADIKRTLKSLENAGRHGREIV